MTQLDQQLYAWISEPDDRRFERGFSAYFAVAYPAVVRRLAKMSRWDTSQLEEIAQDALLRFFDRIGRSRRQAGTVIRDALVTLRPLPLGLLHERQVQRWRSDVSDFHGKAMAFRPAEDAEESTWKGEIRALAEQMPALQSQGYRLILSVCLHLGGTPTDRSADPEATEAPSVLAERFTGAFKSAHESVAAYEHQLPGVGTMVVTTWTVTDALPRLRVPTNGYLFEMVTSLYLDECKRRHRLKRGGTGLREPSAIDGLAAHPLGDLPDGVGDSTDLQEGFDDPDAQLGRSAALSNAEVPVADSTLQLEHTEFLEKFLDYLRQPVTDAAEAYAEAATRGRAAAERHRLQSLSSKLDRTLAVLGLMGEGYTQEEAAAELQLSRNQVKYIVEKVQEAYERFTARSVAQTRAPADPGVCSHD